MDASKSEKKKRDRSNKSNISDEFFSLLLNAFCYQNNKIDAISSHRKCFEYYFKNGNNKWH